MNHVNTRALGIIRTIQFIFITQNLADNDFTYHCYHIYQRNKKMYKLTSCIFEGNFLCPNNCFFPFIPILYCSFYFIPSTHC